MSLNTRAYNIAMSALTLAFCVSCGGGAKSKSQEVEITVVPDNPIVITGNRKVNGQDIEPPWFEFRMVMTNNSDETVTIVALTTEVSGQGSSGQTTTTELTFSPSDFDFNIGSLECKFSTFGTWIANQSKGFELRNGNDRCDARPVFIAGGNPKGVGGNTYRYRVIAKPLGWFGTESEATGRFKNQITFFTE